MGSPNRNFFAFLQQCMDQNLEHARHVENERLAFTGIYITITTAYLSFGILKETPVLHAIILTFLTFIGVIAFFLNLRWQAVFLQTYELHKILL